MPTPPWRKPQPELETAKAKTKLTPANIEWAKARAKKAGRRYPNLVDNMAASRRQQEAGEKQAAPDKPDHP